MKIMPDLTEVKKIASEAKYNVLPVSLELLSDFHFAIDTGDLQFRIKTKKRISSPCLVCLGGF